MRVSAEDAESLAFATAPARARAVRPARGLLLLPALRGPPSPPVSVLSGPPTALLRLRRARSGCGCETEEGREASDGREARQTGQVLCCKHRAETQDTYFDLPLTGMGHYVYVWGGMGC